MQYFGEKKTKFFTCGVILLYVVHETFIEVTLFQEISPAPKNCWVRHYKNTWELAT